MPRHRLTRATLRPVQREALEAIQKGKRGIVTLPCGSGKTIVALSSIIASDAMVALIITSGSQAALQLERDIIKETDFSPDSICLLTGNRKDVIPSPETLIITTYSLFGRSEHSAESRFLLDQLDALKFDVICLDEAHMAPAATFRSFVQRLIDSPRHGRTERVLALTATPYRERQGAAARTSPDDELTEKDFQFIGPPLYRATWTAMQRVGVIAKLRFLRVICDFPLAFQRAYNGEANGVVRNDIACLPTAKVEAAAATSAFHRRLGGRGLVFVEKLLLVKLLVELDIFPGFMVVSGENSEEANALALRKLETGEIPGLILTRVGDSALDLKNRTIEYEINLDGQGSSRRQFAQRAGRVSRTPDDSVPGETEAEAQERRLKSQKQAFIYDFMTKNTKEIENGENRARLLADEGYLTQPPEKDEDLAIWETSGEEMVQEAVKVGVVPRRLTPEEENRLLSSLIDRQVSARIESEVKSARHATREQQRGKDRAHKSSIASTKSPLMKQWRSQQYSKSKAQRVARNAEELVRVADQTRAEARSRV